MIITILVIAFMFVSLVCTLALIGACIVSGRHDNTSQSSTSLIAQNADGLQSAKHAVPLLQRTHIRPA
jgi:hypothetical protein